MLYTCVLEKWVIRKWTKKYKKNIFLSFSLVDANFFLIRLASFIFPLFYPNIFVGSSHWSVERTITLILYAFCFKKGKCLEISYNNRIIRFLLFITINEMCIFYCYQCKTFHIKIKILIFSWKTE